MTSVARRVLEGVWGALGGEGTLLDGVRFVGSGSLRSAFAVSDLAAGAVAAAGLAVAEYVGGEPGVTVDRRLASLWFGWSFRAEGWTAPPDRSAVSGDYETGDGWVRLHTNAAHHLAAAVGVLGVAPERAAVAAAVRGRGAEELEAAVVAAGGCAAAMRPMAAWAAHPQGRAVAAEPLVWVEREAQEVRPAGVVRDRARPLAGVRVLDLTRVFAGPVCTRVLAGLGADVLRIDPPGWEEPGVVPEMTLGKRCARLDARTGEGRLVLQELLRGADVLVHGYRPGALDSIGLGIAERRRLRPGLVDVSLDAYGWTGPWAGRRGFDSLVQMSSGIAEEGMRRFGASRPTPLPVQALDHAAGWMMAAAVLRGLVERRAGWGWRARVSLARVAALLAGTAGEVDGTLGGALGGAEDGDFSGVVEETVWGAVRRLSPPVVVGGTPLRWGLPACPLGSGEARWLGLASDGVGGVVDGAGALAALRR